MSFHRHHHHQPQPYVEDEYRTETFEGERVYGAPPPAYACSEGAYERVSSDRYVQGYGHNNSGSQYQRKERLGELGAVGAGAFALYEGHKIKTDPAHAHKHKLEEEAAALGAVGSAGYAYYEHREKDKFEDGRW